MLICDFEAFISTASLESGISAGDKVVYLALTSGGNHVAMFPVRFGCFTYAYELLNQDRAGRINIDAEDCGLARIRAYGAPPRDNIIPLAIQDRNDYGPGLGITYTEFASEFNQAYAVMKHC